MGEAAGASWPTTVAEARAVQEAMRGRVIAEGGPKALGRIAGVDVHYAPRQGLAWAAVAVFEGRTLELVETALAALPVRFPYVPGYLSFREAPAALAALKLLRRPPDLLLVDGQGMAHPRRCGLASHIGVLADTPTIGCAKSRLCGEHDEPAPASGACEPLRHKDEIIGKVVRTRAGTRPLYVSVGHRIGLEEAVRLVLLTTRGFRLPEPTRVADRLSRLHAS
jgi:deoxyribonuclease V